jgi:hypothetical protein
MLGNLFELRIRKPIPRKDRLRRPDQLLLGRFGPRLMLVQSVDRRLGGFLGWHFESLYRVEHLT